MSLSIAHPWSGPEHYGAGSATSAWSIGVRLTALLNRAGDRLREKTEKRATLCEGRRSYQPSMKLCKFSRKLRDVTGSHLFQNAGAVQFNGTETNAEDNCRFFAGKAFDRDLFGYLAFTR
jgi:hypothetical protein